MHGQVVGWVPKRPHLHHAGTRIRCAQPIRWLNDHGAPCEMFDATRPTRYRSVVFSWRYDDSSRALAAELQQSGVRILFDLCDNHFHNPTGDPKLTARAGRLRRMLDQADRLVASTPALAELIASELPSPRPIAVIGDAVEQQLVVPPPHPVRAIAIRHKLGRLRAWLKRRRGEGITPLVWFGIHGGPAAAHGMLDLLRWREILETLHREHPLSLTVISNSRAKYRRAIRPWALPTHYLSWRPESFLEALREHAVVLIPVEENPFTRVKSNNRLALSLHHGLAVVADPLPSYTEFADCSVQADVEAGLRRYLADPEARGADVAAGQALVARRHTIEAIGPAWAELLAEPPGRV